VGQAAGLTFQQEIFRTLEKYGTPEKVPQKSMEYLAEFGRTSQEVVKQHLEGEYAAMERSARFSDLSGATPYPYYGSYRGVPNYGSYPYSIRGAYPYPGQGFDPHVASVYERRYRQHWKDEYLTNKGPQRPSRDYWPKRVALRGEKERSEAWAKKAWREAYGTWWGYPWEQRSNYLWSNQETRRYQRSLEKSRFQADRAYRKAYEKELRAQAQASAFWGGMPAAMHASTNRYAWHPGLYNYGYNPYNYGNYGYRWNPPPSDRNFNSPLNRWFQARMRGAGKASN
jgi:hypothetical protein